MSKGGYPVSLRAVRISSLLGPELRATLSTNPEVVQEALRELHPEDIAELIGDLPEEDAVVLVQCLPEDLGASVLERLNAERQVEVLQNLDSDEVTEILSNMSPDDRVDVLQKLPDEEAEQVIATLEREDPSVAEEIRELTVWGEDTAGGLMTTDYVSLSPDTKVWEAIEAVRAASQKDHVETIYYIYVCAFGNRLVGVVSLRDLILGDPSQTLEYTMTENVVWMAPEDDQEKVAATIAKYDLSALPVVNKHGRMMGVVTVDDVVDVVIEEATEDAQKVAAVVPLEDSYFATSFFEFVWKRAAWLVILFLGQLLTTTVMKYHQTTLALAMDLILFIPLIIASGGNAGSQSSSLIIRALAIGEIEPGDWLRVLTREVLIGIALGVLLGLIGFARASWVGGTVDPIRIGVVVGVSIVSVVALGTLVGALFPLGIRRIGFDPAVSSTPFIASLVDVLGLLVYFGVAQLALRALINH